MMLSVIRQLKLLHTINSTGQFLRVSHINCIFTQKFSVYTVQNGRTQWSYTRPKNTHMHMDLEKHLIDGKFYRNQKKGGRGEDGRIKIRHIGGGHQRNWRIVDFVRVPLLNDEQPKVIKDRILQIGYDPFRTANIAKVAGNGSNKTKLIICPHLAKIGDILTASREKPESLARMIPGDAYPLEYLPIGTMVHNIESTPGGGAKYARAAGMYATIVQRTPENQIVLKFNGGARTEVLVDMKCLAVIGRVSNIDKKNEIIGKAGRSRWLNRRPRGQTGKDRWHHKKKVR
ncbi:large ribosomal subunit protein uL2m [Hydra vulgaris]|uniref:Large ribosomal subunit protein uL2m n=1 Tax=Hydra vulgaris TaxID=6087 RepID=A0ABM4CX76_HYDVU